MEPSPPVARRCSVNATAFATVLGAVDHSLGTPAQLPDQGVVAELFDLGGVFPALRGCRNDRLVVRGNCSVRDRGYESFEVEGKHKIKATKGKTTIRAEEGDDDMWRLSNATPLESVPQGKYLDVRPLFSFGSRETFSHSLDELEGEERSKNLRGP